MPEARSQRILEDILDIVMFEHWLRFYFIEEFPDGRLELKLPPKSIERIKELYPALFPLAAKLNGKVVDFESSRAAVLDQIRCMLAEKGMADPGAILADRTFQTRLELFHVWEQLHENQLEQGFMEYGAWRNLFAKWLEAPGPRELAGKLCESAE